MEHRTTSIDHRKRKRRRRADTPLISAWLTSSEQIKGNVGTISRDLYTDLFRQDPLQEPTLGTLTRYIAITPWIPLSQNFVEDANWTILPFRVQETSAEGKNGLGSSSIQFSATSLALQTFA